VGVKVFKPISVGLATHLLEQLRSSDIQTQTFAAKAIIDSALNHDNQNVIREVGAIPDLVGLLEKDQPELLEYLAIALCRLSYDNAENIKAIAEAGGISRLVNLLGKNRPELQKTLVETLSNLAADNPVYQNDIREAGAVPILEGLSHNANHSLQTEANNLLSKLNATMAFSLTSDASSTEASHSAKPM
jgi:hypothetical protein